MQVTSPAFAEGEFIPRRYTCDGDDLSPPLEWLDVPSGARSMAVVCDDPDAPAGTWVHWVIYGLSAAVTGLAEGVRPVEVTADGAKQGVNDFRRIGYGGPCPPPDAAHRYFFRLYAMDCEVDLSPGATKAALLKAIEGHVVEEAALMGRYKRAG